MTIKHIILPTVCALGVVAYGCSCSHDKTHDTPLTAEQDSLLAQQAERDIAAITDPEANDMQREKSIFEVRARETRLRDNGYNEAADRYIRFVEEHIRPVIDSCANN